MHMIYGFKYPYVVWEHGECAITGARAVDGDSFSARRDLQVLLAYPQRSGVESAQARCVVNTHSGGIMMV